MSITLLLAAAAFAGPYDLLTAPTKASTAADEYRMGQEYMESRRWLMGAWDNPAEQLRVERIVRRLISRSDRPDQVYTVTLLADTSLNASALPGGFITVNRGLLEALDDDELAFVLAHELSHVMLRHAVNRLNVQTATMSVAELQRARASGDKASAAARADELTLMMAGHSRQLELEADLYGLVYAVRGGHPAASAVTAMKKLQASVPSLSGVWTKAYSTHPEFDVRIAELEKGAGGVRRTAAEFDAGLSWLDQGRPEKAGPAFQRFLTVFPQSAGGWANLAVAELLQDPGAKSDPYAEELAVHRESGVVVRDASAVHRDRARDALEHARKLDPHDALTLALVGVLARREGYLDDAERAFDEALALEGESAAVWTGYGNVLAAKGKTGPALKAWERAVALDSSADGAWVNLARWYTTKKQKKKALAAWEAVAEVPAWRREAAAAITALGPKPKAVAAGAKAVAEGLALSTGPVRPGDPLSAAVAALGVPDVDLVDPEGGERAGRYLIWDVPGVAALAEGDRLVQLELLAPTALTTTSGWGLPCAPDLLLQALGPAPESRISGDYADYGWPERGVYAAVDGGEVWELRLEAPRP